MDIEEDDGLPRSSCSIDEAPHDRKVVFNLWADNNKAKQSHKEISDRFLPLRKGPTSMKCLAMEASGEDFLSAVQEKKGISVTDLLKMEVLGQNCKWQKDTEIQSFSNNNLLKFHEN